jgi:hypothetical protein
MPQFTFNYSKSRELTFTIGGPASYYNTQIEIIAGVPDWQKLTQVTRDKMENACFEYAMKMKKEANEI